MKRISTAWMAAAKNLWWKLLLILVLMAAAEIALFHWSLRDFQIEYDSRYVDSFLAAIERSKLKFVFLAAVVALTACCCLQGSRFSGKNTYLLQRMPMAEWQLTALWAMVHLAAFLILWAAQLLTVFVLWKQYLVGHPSSAPGLELLVSFYNNGFLHGILPLRDVSRWIILLVFWLCMGWLTASFGFFQRRGQIPIGLLIMLGGYFFLTGELGNVASCWIFIIVFLLNVAGNIHRMWGVYHEAQPD